MSHGKQKQMTDETKYSTTNQNNSLNDGHENQMKTRNFQKNAKKLPFWKQ